MKLKPKVRWPATDNMEKWTLAEMRAVGLAPVVTGIGQHPRTVSDEDWIVACERDEASVGTAQFLVDLLYSTRKSVALYIGPPAPVVEYPKVRTKEKIPLPTCAHHGDKDWGNTWTAAMVEGVLCNPLTTGIPGLIKPVVVEKLWLESNLKMVKQIGLRQYLANYLYQLRSSVLSQYPRQ